MKNILILILIFIFIISCDKYEDKYDDFYITAFRTTVDSVQARTSLYYKVHKIKINNKWYILPSTHYNMFIEYVEKGDSLIKSKNHWDLIVKKEKYNFDKKKYFTGAKGYWDNTH